MWERDGRSRAELFFDVFSEILRIYLADTEDKKPMAFHESQLQAIQHKDGPMLVLAGPGSGKTTVITHRIQYLVKEHQVEPGSVLVITFTKAAAQEMKQRFQMLTEGRRLPVSFGTFHGVFFGI